MNPKNTIYVVHCIDTEGPLYESIAATFERVNKIFDLDLEVSNENLKKLQNKELDLNGKEDKVYNVVAPKRINTNDTWDKIDNMLDKITNDDFRNKYKDSYGNGWIYNWFCMDHVGFTDENPRRRDMGYHNIFDHYMLYNKLNNNNQDLIQWHYHPLPIIKDAHRSGTAYLNSSNIYEILARKIIDRNWFPSTFRPGFHAERPGSHWFLEQWIPFDYANQACDDNVDQPDLSEGRFGDWRRAPKSWIPYKPDFHDYQKKGNCNRYIARCLNMEARLRELKKSDIEKAFEEARENGNSLLAFTDHDFRDMSLEIDKVAKMIKEVTDDYPDVKFKHSNAIDAMRNVLDLNNNLEPDFNVSLKRYSNKAELNVTAKNNIFGSQPFLALKTHSNEYIWDNFDFQGENHWSYTFDFNTIKVEALAKIGIAANNNAGITEVQVMNLEDDKIHKNISNKF